MLMPWTLAPADAESERSVNSAAVWASSSYAGRHIALVALASAEFFWRGSGKGNLQASLGMHDPNPMKSKTSSCFLADLPSVWVSPKNSVILASAMTQSGVLGKEMQVYVDNINM